MCFWYKYDCVTSEVILLKKKIFHTFCVSVTEKKERKKRKKRNELIVWF